MTKYFKIVAIRSWLLILVSLTFLNSVFAQEEKVQLTTNEPLRISIMSVNPPFSMLTPSGKPIGLYVDVWKLWSEQVGIPVVFVPEIYSDNIETLQKGEADFHAGLFINAKRLEWADFSIPIHSIPTHIFVNDNADFAAKIPELSEKLIGVGEDSFQDFYLQKYYPKIQKATFEDYEQVVQTLLREEVDAIISEAPFVDAQLALMGIKGAIKRSSRPLSVNTVHAMVPKGNDELVELINQGISKLNRAELVELEKKWLPNYPPYFDMKAIDFLATLTFEQQTWLRKKENLTFQFNAEIPPLEFTNTENQYSGIGADYLDMISQLLNIQVNQLPLDGWDGVITNIQNRGVDILPVINFDQDLANNINFSNAYIDFSNVIVTKIEGKYIQSIEDLSGSKVGVVDNYQIGKILLEDYPELDVVFVKNIEEGISKVQDGEIFAYVDNLAIVSYYIKKHNLKDVKIASFTSYNSKISFGIRKGLEPLLPILNKALAAIGQQRKDAISDSWLTYKINRNANILEVLSWSVAILVFSSLIIGYVIRSNKKLKMEIEHRIEVEQNLEKETIFTQKINKAKDDFLSNMSHEIRTPMNAIVGTANLLRLSDLDNEQKEYLDTMNTSADVLLHLIDDIIDLSEIGTHGVKLSLSGFKINELFNSLIKQASARILEANKVAVPIRSKIFSDVPEVIVGDPMRLGQLIINFLSNALKFTERGSIIIGAKLYKSEDVTISESDDNKVKIVFFVEDSGIGMSQVQQKALFQAYTQADSSISRKYGGTGLGLSICKSICKAMDGEIWVESELGKGSRFFFSAEFEKPIQSNISIEDKVNPELDAKNNAQLKNQLVDQPSARATDKDALNLHSTHLNKKQVLIVDDNEINLTIASKMLEKVGVLVTTAKNGVESIEKLKQAEFDAVLMDLQMPVMDGYQATKIIRENSQFEDLPIIAFSANVMKKDIESAITAGMNAHLAKPLKLKTLLRVLSEQINLRVSGKNSSPKKITSGSGGVNE